VSYSGSNRAFTTQFSPEVPNVGPGNIDESGPTQLELTGDPTYNDTWAWAYSSEMIPVIPGATYVLTGWVYTSDGGEIAQVSFNGGWDQNGNSVSDGPWNYAINSQTRNWEQLSITVTMPSDVYNTEVWLGRFGQHGDYSWSLFDDVRLQLVSLPPGYTPPGWN
jgi:hypothetical protein